MTKTASAYDRIADAALAVAAAALLAERAAHEISDRDRVIRIAKREGATLRALADATGLSRQTIANICAAESESAPASKRERERERRRLVPWLEHAGDDARRVRRAGPGPR